MAKASVKTTCWNVEIRALTLVFHLLLNLAFTLTSPLLLAQEMPNEVLYCQNQLKDRAELIGLKNYKASDHQNLKECVEEVFDLYNPSIYLKKNINFPDFSCGYDIFCGSKKQSRLFGLNFFAGAQSYVKSIKEELGAEEVIRLDRYVKSQPEGILWDVKDEKANKKEGFGLELIVTQSYNEFSQNDGMSLNQLSALKKILVDVTYHFIKSELMDLGFQKENTMDQKISNDLATHYSNSLNQCFKASDEFDEMTYCLSELRTYASFGLAKEVLDKSIEKNFINFVPKSYQEPFINGFTNEFYTCSTIFVLNRIESSLASEKIISCVYSSLMKAFKSILDINIKKNIKSSWGLKANELNQRREKSLSVCGFDELFKSPTHSIIYYEKIMKIKPNDFESKVLGCLPLIEESLVKELIYLNVVNEKSILEFYQDKTKDFAQGVLKDDFPKCLALQEKLGQKRSPEACQNYLYSATVFKFSIDVISTNIQEQLKKLFGPTFDKSLKANMLNDVIKITSQCQDSIKVKSIKETSLTQNQLEVEIVGCVRKGVVRVGESILALVVPYEIENHPYLQEYKVSVDLNKIQELQNQFGTCLDKKLESAITLNEFQLKVDSSLNQCELESYKSVLVFVLDDILKDELTNIGMTSQQANAAIEKYKENKMGLFGLIGDSKTKIDLIEKTENAYYKIVTDLAEEIIGFMIKKEASDSLLKDEFTRVRRVVTEKFLACSDNNDIKKCQNQVMPIAIESILVNVLPREGAQQFALKARSLFTDREIKDFNLRNVFRSGLDTNHGKQLTRYIVEQISKGQSMKSVQGQNYFLTKIYEILTSNNRLIDQMMTALIQPRLDEKKKSLGLLKIFVHKEIFVWNNLKTTPIGIEVIGDFKELMRKMIVVKGSRMTESDVQRIATKVEDAARNLNRSLNRSNN